MNKNASNDENAINAENIQQIYIITLWKFELEFTLRLMFKIE